MFTKWNTYALLLVCLLPLLGCSKGENQAQGYIEGRYTYVATSVSGVLESLPVERGTFVKQGDLLFTLQEQPESDVYRAAVESLSESIAAKQAIEANLVFAKLTYERYKTLVPQKAISQSQLDNALATYNATQAQLAQAGATISMNSAQVAEASWRKEQKKQYAPVNAIVFDTYYRLGEYTIANEPILSLLAPADIKAIFYLNEPIMSRIRLGDKVSVKCASCKNAHQGIVSFISPSAEYTPPVIYSNQTNEKLIYRIEARFSPSDAYQLHPGQPVTVTYTLHE